MSKNNLNLNVIKASRFERSEIVQEIVSSRPSFLVRYGIIFFFLIIILLLIACWYIEYPDIVISKARLTSINAPKEVMPKINGKLIKLFAKEGEKVKQGEILGYMESLADHEDIIELYHKIEMLSDCFVSDNSAKAVLSFFANPFPFGERQGNLGEIQQPYQTYLQSYHLFKSYLSNGFYLKKRIMLSKDMAFLQKMHDNLLEEKILSSQDLELSNSTFGANEALHKDRVISEFDYRVEKSKLINKQFSMPQINIALISNEAQQNEKLKEIMELENNILQQKNIFIQSLNTFKSQIEDWRNKYLLIAPLDGKIAFATFLQENQQLQTNQVLCYINPENTSYYAEVFIPQPNFGKITTGQIVLLKFPSYPFQEYGSLNGVIDFISNISTDSGYLAKVILTQGLYTNYKKSIQYRDGLNAHAEIITKDMRLLQRFYYTIFKQVKN